MIVQLFRHAANIHIPIESHTTVTSRGHSEWKQQGNKGEQMWYDQAQVTKKIVIYSFLTAAQTENKHIFVLFSWWRISEVDPEFDFWPLSFFLLHIMFITLLVISYSLARWNLSAPPPQKKVVFVHFFVRDVTLSCDK